MSINSREGFVIVSQNTSTALVNIFVTDVNEAPQIKNICISRLKKTQ